MRRVALLLFTLQLAATARAYTIYFIEPSELHRYQMHAMRALLMDNRAESGADLTSWVGDPGGETDLFAAGVAARWHSSRSSGFGYGFALETHSSTVGAWLLQAHLTRRLANTANSSLVATAAFGYQRLGGGYGLSCQGPFGGYSERAVDSLDYAMLGAALHGERRFAWFRVALDMIYTQARPSLVEGDHPFGPSESCEGDPEEVAHMLQLGAGLGVGGEHLELYAGVVSSMLMMRVGFRF